MSWFPIDNSDKFLVSVLNNALFSFLVCEKIKASINQGIVNIICHLVSTPLPKYATMHHILS